MYTLYTLNVCICVYTLFHPCLWHQYVVHKGSVSILWTQTVPFSSRRAVLSYEWQESGYLLGTPFPFSLPWFCPHPFLQVPRARKHVLLPHWPAAKIPACLAAKQAQVWHIPIAASLPSQKNLDATCPVWLIKLSGRHATAMMRG